MKEEILHIQELNNAIIDLQSAINGNNVNIIGATIEALSKEKFKVKEALVLKFLENQITETTIKGRGTVWQVKCPDKSRPRFTTYEALIEHIYGKYLSEEAIENRIDYSFKNMFELALAEHIASTAPKEKTIRDYWNSYKAFITDDFGARDIRSIAPSEIKIYIQKITSELSLTKKRFYKFKGLLNLVFEYACEPERLYIDRNPVPTKNAAFKKNLIYSTSRPEDKAFQLSELEIIREECWRRIYKYEYDINAYAILFSSETGVREGEIPSLKWNDIKNDRIHIHSQQNDELVDGVKTYYYNPTTKNEKGVSRDGRMIPLTNRIRKILDTLKENQKALGIESEWVFSNKNGEWITTVAYYEALYKLCKKLDLNLTNNHAFRIALNSYVYVPMGMVVTDRAKYLGHSVEVNLKHYTFASTDDNISDISAQIDAFNTNLRGTSA